MNFLHKHINVRLRELEGESELNNGVGLCDEPLRDFGKEIGRDLNSSFEQISD